MSFTEGNSPLPIADAVLISDPDSTTIHSATITLTNQKAGDALAIPLAGVIGVGGSGGNIILTGEASFEE